MTIITGNRNFFSCLLLLDYKSKWAQIWTTVVRQLVVKYIFLVFLWNFLSAYLYRLCIFW